MEKILSIAILLACMGCANIPDHKANNDTPKPEITPITLPSGYTVAEDHPHGLFIRITSSERANPATIRAIAEDLGDKYDRIDFCREPAHERGDEYASVIDDKVLDFELDAIYSITINQ